MEQGKIMEAEALTVRVGATQTGLMAPHPHNPQGFLQAGCPSCRPTSSVKAVLTYRIMTIIIPVAVFVEKSPPEQNHCSHDISGERTTMPHVVSAAQKNDFYDKI